VTLRNISLVVFVEGLYCIYSHYRGCCVET